MERQALHYGGGIIDTIKSFFKPTPKPKVIPKPPKKVRFVEQLNRSFEQLAANKKAGDEIVKLLSRENPAPAKPSRKKIVRQAPQMTQQEINNRVLQIMSGGKIAP